MLAARFNPMHLKPLAWLSLAALLGCNGTPGLPALAPQATPSKGMVVQGLVTVRVESASVSDSALQAVVPTLILARFMPLAEESRITSPQQAYFKRDAAHEGRYEYVEDKAEADVVAEIFQGDPTSLLSQVTFKRGTTPAVTADVLPFRQPPLWVYFPKETTGAPSVTIKAGSDLSCVKLLSTPGEGPLTIAVSSSQTLEAGEFSEIEGLKDAQITFKVTDSQGKPVTGVTKEFFNLFVYPKSDEYMFSRHPRAIHTFEDLTGGRYRITHTFVPEWQSETTRFRVEVSNPEATHDATFYRR